jgi:uncharacterized membrane protein YbhN (UPF0104 family)
VLTVIALCVMTAAVISAISVDGDTGGDSVHLARLIALDLARLRWQFTVIVCALATAHYAAAALAARAASGLRLPLAETLLVQLAASAADRLTPAGLGGSAVNARYFSCRGLKLPEAVGAVAALSLFGPATDLGVLALLVLTGRWIGLHGASGELSALSRRVAHYMALASSPWLWCGLALLLVIAVLLCRRRGSSRSTSILRPVRELFTHPGRLAVLAGSSGATTLILGFAFVASVAMVPGPRPVIGMGALLIAFMIGSAVGTAVPMPAGLGTTEAALVAVLVGAGVAASAAVQQVLIFRLLTFWLPAAFGVFATRRLHRQGAL